MSELTEAATDTATEATGTETVAEETTTEAASAETENTETAAEERAAPGPVPYSRFKEVNDRLRESKAELEELRAERAERAEAKPAVPVGEESEPPANLTPRQKIAWFVRHDANALIQEQLGMSLGDAKALLAVTREVANESAERRFDNLCREHGVNSKDAGVRREVAGLLKSNVPLDTAVKVAAALSKKPAAATAAKPATVEDGGVTAVMTQDDRVIWDAHEAAEAARKGIKSPHLSVEQVFAKAKKR